MRKFIAFVLSWLLVVLGEIVNGINDTIIGRIIRLYPIYNWLMPNSAIIQECGGNKSPGGKV